MNSLTIIKKLDELNSKLLEKKVEKEERQKQVRNLLFKLIDETNGVIRLDK